MLNSYQIKQTVQFTEYTTIPKEQSENALFDILQEDVKDNDTYCQELISKILKLPYAKLPDLEQQEKRLYEQVLLISGLKRIYIARHLNR